MLKFTKVFLFVFCCLGIGGLSLSAKADEVPLTIESNVILDVGKMEVTSDYAPTSSDNIDISLNPTPVSRIKEWLNKHFKAKGQGEDKVKFVITNASIVEEYIPPKGLSLSSAYKYNANFSVRASITNASGKEVKSFISKVWGTKTIPDSSTIEERTDTLAEMADTLIASLAEQISGGVQSTFKSYIDKNILN